MRQHNYVPWQGGLFGFVLFLICPLDAEDECWAAEG